MLTPRINFKNFNTKFKSKINLKEKLNFLIKENNEVLKSLGRNYKNNFSKKKLVKYKKFSNIRVIGMGGSILGTQAIYDFLKFKIKKNFSFVNNLQPNYIIEKKKKFLNLIVSKSGDTTETIVNSNLLIKKKDKNLFITENKKSYLYLLANKLKAEVIHHNNFIGGRYSVLSEVGMLPAELMGLKSNYFKQFNNLIKDKKFLNSLISNVCSILYFTNTKKFNSILINYDNESKNLLNWYQQLVAESLGKNQKGLLPIVSNMPKDNHSVMQLYLDGFQNNFFTFFFTHDRKSLKMNSDMLLPNKKYLSNKNVNEIMFAQKKATENVFKKKKYSI